MYFGPVHPTLAGVAGTPGHNPFKETKVTTQLGKEYVLFDMTYPVGMYTDQYQQDFQTIIWENSQAAALARLMQIKELHQNYEWQRCGLYVQLREDTNDPEDGWYFVRDTQVPEELLVSGFAKPKITIDLRSRFNPQIGVYADSKYVPNAVNGAGNTLVALPQGFGGTTYPTPVASVAANGCTIALYENPSSVIRGTLVTPINTMTLGRVQAFDQTTNRTTQTEVFWRDHRLINQQWEINNGLVRYYVTPGNTPAIDIYDTTAAGWVTLGNYQMQTANGGTVLPVQSVQFTIISPEEVVWVERRFDSGGIALVLVSNRIRRGSRIIESQIVAASGAGLTGAQSIGITGAPNVAWQQYSSSDNTGLIFSDDFENTGGTAASLPSATIVYNDGFETAGTTALLFRSLGTDGLGTLAAWSQVSGSWTIASNLVTSPTTSGNLMVVGHPDWWDGTYNLRVKWVTSASISSVLHCDGTANNLIRARIDGANFHVDKIVGGTTTNDVIASTAAALTNGNFYWIQINASGTTYTCKVFNDSAGAIGTQVGSTMAPTISDAGVQTGKIGMMQTSTVAWTAGGAFTQVCAFTGPVPAHGGSNWVPGFAAGEPAMCWSKVLPYSGTRSVSVWCGVSSGHQGTWTSAQNAFADNVTLYQITAATKNSNGATTPQAVCQSAFDTVPGFTQSTADGNWYVSNSGAYATTGASSPQPIQFQWGGLGVGYCDALYLLRAPVGPNNILFKSIGTDSAGTLAAWTTDAGAPSISANVVTVPSNAALHAGHPDWWDGTALVRFIFATNSQPSVFIHGSSSSADYIGGVTDGNNLFLRKQIPGSSNVSSISGLGLVPSGSYWMGVQAAGTTYTVTVYEDAGGIPGNVIGTTSGTATDSVLTQGYLVLSNLGSASCTFGGAAPQVCFFVGPMPSNVPNGANWSTSITAGDPAFCWSKVQFNTGARSISINNVGGAQGSWAFTTATPINTNSFMIVGAIRATGGPATVQWQLDAASAAPAFANDSSWHVVTGSSVPTSSVLRAVSLTNGLFYFDTVSIGVGASSIGWISASSKLVPGFLFLTQQQYSAYQTGTVNFWSGLTVPSGTIARIGILCGDQDAHYSTFANGQLYISRYGSYNRQRVKQRILVGGAIA